MRARAGRFAAFTDQLYTPPWSVERSVDQARRHGVQGVPVLELHADNVDDRQYDTERVHRDVERWLEERVLG